MSKPILKGVTWDHPRGLDGLRRCARAYAEEHGVEVQWSARSLKDFGDAPIDQLAGAFDLLIIDHPHVGWAHATKALAPLDQLLSSIQLGALRQQSIGRSHESYDYADHQWALAVDTAMQAASYRPDLVRTPLPRHWPEALDFARQLRRRGLQMAIPFAPTDCICLFISLCAGAGDTPGRRDDGRFVSREIARPALALLRELFSLCPAECLTWNPIALLDAMATRSDLAYCPASFIYTNYARTGFRPNLVRFGNIPGPRGSCLGGAGIAVSAQSGQRQRAAEFACWVSEAGTQRTLYVESQGQPGNRAAWLDPRANALTHNFFRDTFATAEAAYVRPRHAAWPAFQEEAGNCLHRWLGERPAADDDLITRLESLHASGTSTLVSSPHD